MKNENTFEILKEILEMKKPSEGFYKLKDERKLESIFPELFNMIGKEHKIEHHAEGDVFEHTMLVLDQANNESLPIKFAALFHDIGKPDSYDPEKKTFYSHDKNDSSINLISALKEKLIESSDKSKENLDLINEMINLSVSTIKYHHTLRDVFNPNNKSKIKNKIKLLEEISKIEEIDLEELLVSINTDTKGRISVKVSQEYSDLSKEEQQQIIENRVPLTREEVSKVIEGTYENNSKEVEFKYSDNPEGIIDIENGKKIFKLLTVEKIEDIRGILNVNISPIDINKEIQNRIKNQEKLLNKKLENPKIPEQGKAKIIESFERYKDNKDGIKNEILKEIIDEAITNILTKKDYSEPIKKLLNENFLDKIETIEVATVDSVTMSFPKVQVMKPTVNITTERSL